MDDGRRGRGGAATRRLTRDLSSAGFVAAVVLALGFHVARGALVGLDEPLTRADAILGGDTSVKAAIAPLTRADAIHLVGTIGLAALAVVGLVPQLLGPRAHVAAQQQALIAGLALTTTAVLLAGTRASGRPGNVFSLAYLWFVGPVLPASLLDPAREAVLCMRRPPLALLSVAVLTAAPLLVYAWRQAERQCAAWPPLTDLHHNDHWFVMSALGFAIPAVLAVAALHGRGWRLSAWTAATVLASVSLVSMVFPGAPSSFGREAGLAALLVLPAVVAVLGLDAERRPRADVGERGGT